MGNPAGVKRDFEALEKRRFQALRLLGGDLNQSEVARRLHVARQTVSRWVQQYHEGGNIALQKAGRAGRKPQLTPQNGSGFSNGSWKDRKPWVMRLRCGPVHGWPI